MGRKAQTLENLLKHTEKVGNCLLYTRYKDKDGYGVSSIKGIKTPAHRIVYTLTHPNEDITGKYILHKQHCNNPSCINPDHLYLGSQKENIKDQLDLNTFVKGTKNGMCRLTEDQVKLIRSSSLSNIELSKLFNVSYYTIWDIKKERSWKHLL